MTPAFHTLARHYLLVIFINLSQGFICGYLIDLCILCTQSRIFMCPHVSISSIPLNTAVLHGNLELIWKALILVYFIDWCYMSSGYPRYRIRAVSYTHLDVYKRQALRTKAYCMVFMFRVTVAWPVQLAASHYLQYSQPEGAAVISVGYTVNYLYNY